MEVICKNCGSSTQGKYCHNCGQRTSINKVTFKETFQDFVDTVFSVNSPLLLTLKLLLTNPGKLFREYLSGKRKTYYKPVPFFILISVVFVLIKALINFDPLQGVVMVGGKELDMNLFNNAAIFMAKNANNIIFIFVFTFSVMIKLFFYKKYAFAEFIAVSFYVIGFYTIITTALMFFMKYVNSQLKMLPFMLMAIYVIYALTSFFKTRSFLTIIKAIVAYFFAVIFYIILGYGISLLIVWLKTI